MQLYLIVEAEDPQAGGLLLGRRAWNLQSYDLDQVSTEELRFLCISYTWGLGREPSPFHDSFNVSDRTIPALRTVTELRPEFQKIWIDAFCVPHEPEERYQCLESMGFIYSRAYEVVAVLSPTSLPILKYMQENRRLEEEQISILEKEEWITRAWTYQEAVNSRNLFITCDGAVNIILAAMDFLNYVGHALSRLQMPQLERRKHYPRLDAFEDLVDYVKAEYEERSALQVMAKMDRRTQLRPEDHFFAMIGAVTVARASSSESKNPCESFMSLCERKGDFSFIYSAAPRSSVPGKGWRPIPGDLPAILPWDCTGSGQPGNIDGEGLVLSQVVRLEPGPASVDAKKFVQDWLILIGHEMHQAPGLDASQKMFSALQLMGFKGSGRCWAVRQGYFFPYLDVDLAEYVLVSSTVQWRFGAPGIALIKGGTGITYSAGVFVGRVYVLPRASERLC